MGVFGTNYMKRLLSTELMFLEAGLAGYMLRISPNDKHNDELLEHLSKAIVMAQDLELKLDNLTKDVHETT